MLLASRVPKALITFLVALAIADDLGAVLVIALFYTQQLALDWLAVSGLLVLLLFVLNFAGIRQVLPYFVRGCYCCGTRCCNPAYMPRWPACWVRSPCRPGQNMTPPCSARASRS